jgi:hypothetical protein
MSGEVSYDPLATAVIISRWRTQATQMRSTTSSLEGATTGGLPARSVGAAQTFLTMWQTTARKSSVAADVYADELTSTGESYKSLDAEIARRMDALGAGTR